MTWCSALIARDRSGVSGVAHRISIILVMLFVPACQRLTGHTVRSAASPAGGSLAYVVDEPSIDPPNQTLWVRFPGTPPQRVGRLGEDTHWCERIVWSPDSRAVLFVAADNQGPDHGLIVWTPESHTSTSSTGRVGLKHVGSTEGLSVDRYGRVSVPRRDLRQEFPLWVPQDAGSEVGLTTDGGAETRLQWPGGIPREAVSGSLIDHFNVAGWTQRSHEILNPRVATSFAKGWNTLNRGVIPVGSTAGAPAVRGWTAEWTRDTGELVRYQLTEVDGTVRGYAYYLTPALTREHERMGKRDAR